LNYQGDQLGADFRLFDIQGRLQHSGVLQQQNSLPSLLPGMYVMQLNNVDGEQYRQRVLVR
jgi:hypothetical protein